MTENKNNILDFEDPGMLSEELMNVPGFVNELMNHTLAVSPRPNKPLAFASVPDSIASGPGLEDAMAENPSLLLQNDEADTHLTKRMLYMAQFYVAEGKFDRLKKRCVALIAKAGGSLDRTSLLHKLSIDAVTFKKLIVTLEMCNLVESELSDRGKYLYHLSAA